MVEPVKKNCAGCGIEIDPEVDQLVEVEEQSFCIWCWSNDCCRVSRDAAEEKQQKGEK